MHDLLQNIDILRTPIKLVNSLQYIRYYKSLT